MKYCLSSRQTNEYLQKADEIKVKYRDRNIIYDFSQKYPNATFILEMPLNSQEINWDEIAIFNTVSQQKLIICLANLHDVNKCKELNIPFYYGFPVGSFYELNSLKTLGVCYFRLGTPAFFMLDKVKELGVPVRAVPNVAYDAYFPHENGIHGTWIRPEDISTYAEYVDAFEFEDADLAKERALFRIYHDDGEWPGNLNMLFTNFNYSVENQRMLTTDTLAKRRTVCGQRCQCGRDCGLCEMCLDFGRPEQYSETTEASISNP